MYVLVNPYDGYDAKLESVVRKFGGVLKKPKCVKRKGNTCDILSTSLMTAERIQNILTDMVKSRRDINEIVIVAINEDDHKKLVDMSIKNQWGKIKEGLNVKIACEKE
jgi:hypothetical protein